MLENNPTSIKVVSAMIYSAKILRTPGADASYLALSFLPNVGGELLHLELRPPVNQFGASITVLMEVAKVTDWDDLRGSFVRVLLHQADEHAEARIVSIVDAVDPKQLFHIYGDEAMAEVVQRVLR